MYDSHSRLGFTINVYIPIKSFYCLYIDVTVLRLAGRIVCSMIWILLIWKMGNNIINPRWWYLQLDVFPFQFIIVFDLAYSTIDNNIVYEIIMIETDECLQCLNCYTKVNHCEKTSISKQISIPRRDCYKNHKITYFCIFPWWLLCVAKITYNNLFFHSPKRIIMTSLKNENEEWSIDYYF